MFQDGSVSNRQLQVTVLAAAVWSGWLALRTRTAALSTVFGVVGFLFTLAVLADLGLRDWIEQTRFDRLALHVLPLVAAYAVLGQAAERSGRGWLARPLFAGAVLVFVLALELLTLEGRAFEYLHLSMRRFQRPDVSDPLLLDTLTAMTIAGVVFYLTARAIARHGSDLKSRAAWILFSLSPFAMLAPFAWLVRSGEYGQAFDWVYLGLAVGIALLSHERQRRSFYYAGMINTAVALWFIADHHEWFDQPAWAMSLIGIGLAVLAAGFGLAARERRRSKPGGPS